MNTRGIKKTRNPSPKSADGPTSPLVVVDAAVNERLRFEVDHAAQPADDQLAVTYRVARPGQRQPTGGWLSGIEPFIFNTSAAVPSSELQ